MKTLTLFAFVSFCALTGFVQHSPSPGTRIVQLQSEGPISGKGKQCTPCKTHNDCGDNLRCQDDGLCKKFPKDKC